MRCGENPPGNKVAPYKDDASHAQAGLSQEQWQKWISEIRATKSVLIYDTCESGSLTSNSSATRDGRFVEEQSTAIEKLKRATGRTVIVAAGEAEPALEGFRGHGVFSYAVLEGLQKAPLDKDGLIELFDLINYIDTQVPELSYQAFRQRKFPQTKFAGSNFPLAKPVALSSLPTHNQGGDAISTMPTHVVIAPSAVHPFSPGFVDTRTFVFKELELSVFSSNSWPPGRQRFPEFRRRKR